MTKNGEAAIKSVTTVIFKDDKVLLVKNGPDSEHPDGIYGLPAGKVEENETWEEAAKRECYEESGLRPKMLVKLPTFYEADILRKDGHSRRFCCWSFLCLEYEGELSASSETEPLWVKMSDLKRLPLVVNVHRMIYEADIERKK